MATDALVPSQTEIIHAATPMDLLQLAINRDLDIDKLAKLLELQKEWERNEAKKVFEAAFSAFKDGTPEILRTSKGNFGAYADLDEACTKLIPALSKQGINHRWRTDEDKADWIKITCILSKGIHNEDRASLGGPPDVSGSKNAIQSRVSTVSYLERVTLLMACGCSVKGLDKDGSGGQLADLADRLKDIEKSTNFDTLKHVFAKNYKDAKDLKSDSAMKKMTEVYERKKGEFAKAQAKVEGIPIDWSKK